MVAGVGVQIRGMFFCREVGQSEKYVGPTIDGITSALSARAMPDRIWVVLILDRNDDDSEFTISIRLRDRDGRVIGPEKEILRVAAAAPKNWDDVLATRIPTAVFGQRPMNYFCEGLVNGELRTNSPLLIE